LTRGSRLEQRGASLPHHFIAPIVRNANSIYLCADGGNLAFGKTRRSTLRRLTKPQHNAHKF
jgi:hypothetical protein